MYRAAAVPAESDLLCEGCGYVLNGLPEGGRCPECGKPLAESAPTTRRVPAWEEPSSKRSSLSRFAATTAECIFSPARFFRQLSVSPDRAASRRFALLHWSIASVLLGLSAWTHFRWIRLLGGPDDPWVDRLSLPAFVIGAFVFLAGITRLAAALTSYEAAYRGIRLPLPVVRRGLDYHAAHYLPVALVTAVTIVGYHLYSTFAPEGAALRATNYLYVLCGEAVLAAVYLFKTYWIAMRNLMYANRG